MLDNAPLKTPLYDCHLALGAKVVPFAGYFLPVRYSEIREEHAAVRNAAGIFDVSHMGEIFVEGSEALEYLQSITCNDVSKLKPGKAHYSAFLNKDGGVIDDIIVYQLAEDSYMICVNASNRTTDFKWCMDNSQEFNVAVEDRSDSYAQIALQGPKSEEIISRVANLDKDILNLKYFHFAEFNGAYGEIIVARTGYTGEDGYEIFLPAEKATQLWDDLLAEGSQLGLIPCGLGARDSLRLEACYPLHGHELATDISALESGLAWIIKTNKGEFIGKEAIVKQKAEGVSRKLVGFHVKDKGIVRDGASICDETGQSIGIVTSGTHSPTFDMALGLALVQVANASPGTLLHADVRGRKIAVEVVNIPFYRKK